MCVCPCVCIVVWMAAVRASSYSRGGARPCELYAHSNLHDDMLGFSWPMGDVRLGVGGATR
jgi:hypothetical protein